MKLSILNFLKRAGVFFGLAAFAFAQSGESTAALASRVIVLANASSEESLTLARYYAKRRGIPAENIVALPMTTAETIGWREFIDTIYQPLQDDLMRRGWIEGATTALKDNLGRKKIAITGHRISYLVTCRGVPLRVEHDAALYEEVRPYTAAAAFRTNAGAVDAELAAVVRSGYAINAYLPNPLFQKERPTILDLNKLVKVSRLDGPSYELARALVDHAIEAERVGLIGRAYVDIGGPHAEGDGWMKETAMMLDGLGFDLTTDRAPATIPATSRFDAPALYFGWYAGDLNGPFARPDFRFPPGAVALHIHSFSATTMHAATTGWCGPLVAKGVTATFGNVFEPYLTFTHHPHLVMRALARGDNLGDAASYALRALSWQEVVIGDPLYRPFAVNFSDQWANQATLSDDLFPYVVLREVRRLELGGQVDQAISVALKACSQRTPRPALMGKLVQLLSSAGRVEEAVKAFAAMSRLKIAGTDDEAIAVEVFQALESNTPSAAAVEAYAFWLGREDWSRELRLRLLQAAAVKAEKIQDKRRAAHWRGEAEALDKNAPQTAK